jgi:hypothetical protein
VVAAVLVYVSIRMLNPLDAQSFQQAERLRNDLRHAQMLAMTWNRELRLTVAGGSYSVACVTAGTAPCNASPVVDPATGKGFSVTLESGFTLSGPGFTLDFDALGRPKNAALPSPSFITSNASFGISGASSPRQVIVVPVTGFATTQ